QCLKQMLCIHQIKIFGINKLGTLLSYQTTNTLDTTTTKPSMTASLRSNFSNLPDFLIRSKSAENLQ
ncbi:hypothetical protein ACFQ4U_01080, partial [Micrococcus antarcticus]